LKIYWHDLKILNEQQIHEIKLLKKGLYILFNPVLKQKYNLYINKLNTNSEPNADNHVDNVDMDSLFNVDNAWMKNSNNQTNNTDQINGRKNKLEHNNIGDRVFSMSTYNKRPGFSSDFECELRKPAQGRIDKTNEN